MIEEIAIKAIRKGLDSLIINTGDTGNSIQELTQTIKHEMLNKKEKSYLVPAFICTIMIIAAIVGSMYFFSNKRVVSYDPNAISKLEEISKKFDMLDPKIPKMCATHGYYMDPEDEKNNGFRMVRVNRKGFIILAGKQ